ncbi:hypothetical protein EON78_04045 [bacterium]|nr:MAG: hypothetical protein EON78_04045 [bacterium]
MGDAKILNDFEAHFKNHFLFPFQYSSNQSHNIFIQKNEPFKYYPVFKFNASDSLPQPIKTNSSASDFIRTIWAYSLSLLVKGKNHPGILILDEPGQHSVSSASLKVLFEKSAEIKGKQIIFFTSTEKTLRPDNSQTKEILNLELIMRDLKENEDYKIYKLPSTGKSIHML